MNNSFLFFLLMNMSSSSSCCKKRSTVDQTRADPPSKPFQPPKEGFYRRELPPTCTAFDSTQGRQLFAEAMLEGYMEVYFPLAAQFRTQDEPAYCGLTTLVVALNALSVDPRRKWKGVWRWYAEDHLDCCLSLDLVKSEGINMEEFACLGRCNSLSVNVTTITPPVEVSPHQGYDSDGQWDPSAFEASLDHKEKEKLLDFRRTVQTICKDCHSADSAESTQNRLLIVNYSRIVLKQTGDGHFSPIAGYHSSTDQVLILDTARFKYPPHWAPLTLVFNAMRRGDSAGNNRGYAILSRLCSAPLMLFELNVWSKSPSVADQTPETQSSSCYFFRDEGANKSSQCSVQYFRDNLFPSFHAADEALQTLSETESPENITFEEAVNAFTEAYCRSSKNFGQLDVNVLSELSSSRCIDQISQEHARSASQLLSQLESSSVYRHIASLVAQEQTYCEMDKEKCCIMGNGNAIQVKRLHSVTMFLFAWALSFYGNSNTEHNTAKKLLVAKIQEEIEQGQFSLLLNESKELAGQIDGLCGDRVTH
eukprot:gb/GECG01010833.1/.p1 GENE.gb/GECG01010833.1/~~gb/GECG01010833.1/.p1  ORF type:complete len:536 (+),score=59.50 gb/GECG01010833.1/:1-1608(+)